MKTLNFNNKGNNLTSQSGLSIVEFTIVAALFMFMIFSIIEGSRFVFSNGVLSHLAREGARYAAVRGSSAASDPLRSGDAPATEASVTSYINGLSPISNITTSVVWSPDNAPGSEVTVTLTYSFSSFLTLFNNVTINNSASSIIYF